MFVLFTVSGMAQVQVKTDGSLNTNKAEINVVHDSGNYGGIGYGAYGASQMVIFADQYLDFRESDASARVALFNFNSEPYFDFYGDVTLMKNHWTGGLHFDNVVIGNYSFAGIIPQQSWYATLGTASREFGYGYIDHIYYDYLTRTSDKKVKENVRDIKEDKDVKDKLLKLRPVKYDLKENNFDSIQGEARQYLINKSKNEVGFIAQEVQELFPNLVSLDESNNTLGVNYIDFIPYLVALAQEQQQKIDELEKLLAKNTEKSSNNLKSGSLSDTYDETETTAFLGQNTPNPFTEQTTIAYGLPASYTNAQIHIMDMNGRLVSTHQLTQAQGELTINGLTLQPGMYLYSLVVNGQIVDTKKMLLTE